MTDKLEEQKARGARAEALLGSDVFKEAFTQLESTLTEKLISLDITEDKQAERLRVSIKLLRDLHNVIVTFAQNGRLATREIERLGRR